MARVGDPALEASMCVRCGGYCEACCLNAPLKFIVFTMSKYVFDSQKKLIDDVEDQVIVELDRRWAVDHLA